MNVLNHTMDHLVKIQPEATIVIDHLHRSLYRKQLKILLDNQFLVSAMVEVIYVTSKQDIVR